jgi:hypothetical protein
MDTPLIDTKIKGRHADAESMVRERSVRVPMGRMGIAWDVAPCCRLPRVARSPLHHRRAA